MMSTRDEKLAGEIPAGASWAQAAERAGVALRTAKRRAADPAFAARVAELRGNAARLVSKRLDQLALGACDTLAVLLADPDAPAVRLGAAKAILDQMAKAADRAELVQRIEALERARGLRVVS